MVCPSFFVQADMYKVYELNEPLVEKKFFKGIVSVQTGKAHQKSQFLQQRLFDWRDESKDSKVDSIYSIRFKTRSGQTQFFGITSYPNIYLIVEIQGGRKLLLPQVWQNHRAEECIVNFASPEFPPNTKILVKFYSSNKQLNGLIKTLASGISLEGSANIPVIPITGRIEFSVLDFSKLAERDIALLADQLLSVSCLQTSQDAFQYKSPFIPFIFGGNIIRKYFKPWKITGEVLGI